ncbi:MAG: type II/IV secretion system protein, partial [Verrucomicrobiota bacterium]
MIAPSPTAGLPAVLAARLDEETLAALAEATREQRQPLLAAALQLADDTVCLALAEATDLPAELNPAADLDSLRLLPP